MLRGSRRGSRSCRRPWRVRYLLRSSTVTVTVIGCVVGCGSSITPAAPRTVLPSSTHSGAQPGGQPPSIRPIPPRTRPYTSIPQACPLIDAESLQFLVPGSARGHELDPTPIPNAGVTEHTCSWASGTRNLRIIVDLEAGDSGQNAMENAKLQFQSLVSSQGGFDSIRPQAVPGLGDEAQLSADNKPRLGTAPLFVRSQNVLITVAYGGSDDGHAMNPAAMHDGAVAAAHAVLVTLATGKTGP